MPEKGLWSHQYLLDERGSENPNVSLPPSDVFYSLNVLLGFSHIAGSETIYGRSRRDLYVSACAQLPVVNARIYAWGTALWAGAELDYEVPAATLAGAHKLIGVGDDSLLRWTAQDTGMMLSGVVAQYKRDSVWAAEAKRLSSFILEHIRAPSGLFFDAGSGARRQFASFASQVYSILGLYHYGEAFSDQAALAAADAGVQKLLSLQGALGEWPWFYHAPSGRVVDFYEVYSVHQHGMAPAILHHAVARGVPGARGALVKGFGWIFGANEMGRTMLRPELQMIHRSQRRSGWRGERAARLLRAWKNVLLGRSDCIEDRKGAGLEFTQEIRSYELGWILWSFGGRQEYPELTGRPEFSAGN